MLCHDYRTIFVHVPKTAGQSIEMVFLNKLDLTWEQRAPTAASSQSGRGQRPAAAGASLCQRIRRPRSRASGDICLLFQIRRRPQSVGAGGLRVQVRLPAAWRPLSRLPQPGHRQRGVASARRDTSIRKSGFCAARVEPLWSTACFASSRWRRTLPRSAGDLRPGGAAAGAQCVADRSRLSHVLRRRRPPADRRDLSRRYRDFRLSSSMTAAERTGKRRARGHGGRR